MPVAQPKPTVFSGIQPDGPLHIGNYLGAIRNWVRGQDRYHNIFCVVDLHALTTLQDPTALRDRVLETAATYLASGLKDTARVFLQSQVPAHTELAWIFDCFTPMGWLERMTQFKERSARAGGERVNAGLFVYPALMAADILLYDTQFVPVGDDQRQHIEYTRDLAQRMNQRFGDELFVLPQPLIQEAGARIMGLDDPTAKMSKSVAATRPEHALLLLDPPDVIHKKLSRAKTDSKPAVEFPAGPGVTNLLEIYRTLHDLNREAVEEEFAGKPYSALKAAVAESVVEAVRPLQQRYRELRADPAMLSRRLERSLEHVAPIAEAKLGQVRKAVGLEATRRRSPSQ
jgi:tryptophanyl-tRNA synthetase